MKSTTAVFLFFCFALIAARAWAAAPVDPNSPLAKSTLWTVLNSSFALWFLSSVVLAGITAAFARYQKNQSARTQKTATQEHLNTEISSRIADGVIAMRLEQKRVDNGKVYWSSAMYGEARSYMDNRFAGADGKVLDFSIYPEYQGRRFRSLIVEFSAVAMPSMLPALREAQAAYTKLEELADRTSLDEDYSKDPDRAPCLAAIKESCEVLERLQANPFWRSPL